MSAWDSLLVKTVISPAVIEECVAQVPGRRKAECRNALGVFVVSPASLEDLRASVQKWKALLPAELAEDIDEELKEIVADARWTKTSRGAYVRAVSRWIESFYGEFRGIPCFSDVLVGAHMSREVVLVTGTEGSRQIIDELISYLAAKTPPFKLDLDLKVSH